ncbi:hypothetical protein [Spiroplasma endosymbiont of Amphibalanus improvisus]|uniref:hypothetical protein n=1 Tax=Spiroplasma endosymbiont of Amphibalanus improvisus TaxID=3066327 RepID=UPI00313C8D6F
MIKKKLSIDNIEPKRNSPEDEIIAKYFDDVITSFGVDSAKRPEVATKWAIEKERWLNNKDQVLKQNLTKAIKVKKHKYSLIELQKIHLQELTKRSVFLKELNKNSKLPKISNNFLASDSGITPPSIVESPNLFELEDNIKTSLNSGAGIMREIAKQIQEQNAIYQNLPPEETKQKKKHFIKSWKNKK